MKKPLTKEEFLERKNSELHKELLEVFNLKTEHEIITKYWLNSLKENSPPFCMLNRDLARKHRATNVVHDAFYTFVEMIKNGELVFKKDDQ